MVSCTVGVNILIADIERKLGKNGVEGIKVERGERLLKYADDLIMLAKEEKGISWMLRKLEGYLGRKSLILNAKKTKIIRFGKRRRRRRRVRW